MTNMTNTMFVTKYQGPMQYQLNKPDLLSNCWKQIMLVKIWVPSKTISESHCYTFLYIEIGLHLPKHLKHLYGVWCIVICITFFYGKARPPKSSFTILVANREGNVPISDTSFWRWKFWQYEFPYLPNIPSWDLGNA